MAGGKGSGGDARRLSGAALVAALRDSRATTLARVMDLDADAWRVPQRAGLNPVAWELGHLAWFAEFWILRGPHVLHDDGFVAAARPARHALHAVPDMDTGAGAGADADALFDSARIAHAARWSAALPSRAALERALAAQLDACVASIASIADSPDDDAALYFHRLALFHEDMHGEAFAWMRATLGLPAPAGLASPPRVGRADRLRFDAGSVALGRPDGAAGFWFDNEQPARVVRLDAFEIDAAPMSAGEFLRFVEAGGYDDPALWPGAAGRWRAVQGVAHPDRWRRLHDGTWQMRWFDRWLPLQADLAVVHVTAWEAEAYCRWAGRRLPAAAEWVCAAADPRFAWGRSVWEWSADAFLPYPGFAPGPYRDYSAPWFGDHRELRGGSFATHARLHDRRYRNFFTADRSDVFAGFRTASLSP